MHVAEGEEYLADVEHGDIIAESAIFSEAVEELPSGAVLEDHVDEDLILEWGLEGVDEGVVEFHQDVLFQLDVLNLFQIDDVTLRQLLEGEHLFIRRNHLLHSSKGSSS